MCNTQYKIFNQVYQCWRVLYKRKEQVIFCVGVDWARFFLLFQLRVSREHAVTRGITWLSDCGGCYDFNTFLFVTLFIPPAFLRPATILAETFTLPHHDLQVALLFYANKTFVLFFFLTVPSGVTPAICLLYNNKLFRRSGFHGREDQQIKRPGQSRLRVPANISMLVPQCNTDILWFMFDTCTL